MTTLSTSTPADGLKSAEQEQRGMVMAAPKLAAQRQPRHQPVGQPAQDARRVLPPVEVDEEAEERAGEDLELGELVHGGIVRPGAQRVPPHFSRERAEMQAEAAH